MKCFFTAVAFLLFTQGHSIAQFSDDFSDGNLDGWEGNANHFIVNLQGQLQLNAPVGSTNSWLYTSVSFEDSMSWDIYLKLDFAPSTSNQLRIYLGLNSTDVATGSGYFLEIGAGGDQDALELKYQEGGSIQTLASSTPGLVANEPVELRLQVTKNSNGLWQCFNTIGVIPELLFSTTHDLLPLSGLNTFGIYCKYTDSRRDKFFFDDISIQPIVADVTAPTWLSILVIDTNSVLLLFDEVLDPVSAGNAANYVLTPGNLNPDAIVVAGNQVTLTWDEPFISQQHYIITISNIRDAAGNILLSSVMGFDFLQVDQAQVYEILITEIMADPTPVVGLPDAEYLEIHNNSIKIFNLADYKIKIGTTEKSLPDRLLLSGEYIIITDDSNASLFSSFGTVIGIDNFPALTNSGTTITLLNNNGDILQEIKYSLDWYQDVVKSNGGWSLELINSEPQCNEASNWAATQNLSGGTPGMQNSQWQQTPDVDGPILLSLYSGVPGEIEIRFNEKLDEILMLDPGLYPFNPVLDISNIELSDPSTVKIHLITPLQQGVIYQLFPFRPVDCFGNEGFSSDTITFGVVSIAEPGDVLINEILFNPATGGSRFIEIINASNKFIALNKLAIARLSTNDIFPIASNEILGPGEIAVFTPDRDDILSRYEVPRPLKLYELSLPAWDDKSDDAAILSMGIIIDSFTYSAEWHHPVISDQNGVSLERISISVPTSSSSSWHSASSLSGYATPTGPNSQMIGLPVATPPFTIINRHFSPNDDGFKDFLLIDFELESGNDVASIWAYNLEGREIRQILSNETIGTTALIQWDGRNAEGLLAEMGIYLIFIHLWDTDGNTKQYQESCALVKR